MSFRGERAERGPLFLPVSSLYAQLTDHLLTVVSHVVDKRVVLISLNVCREVTVFTLYCGQMLLFNLCATKILLIRLLHQYNL